MDPRAIETGYLQSDDVKLFYRRFRGPGGRAPLIIFHGANYYDSLDWVDVAAGLARDREVLAWDARGFGQSGWSADRNYSFDACLGDALNLLDHFGWSKAVIMGHSIGGSYALLFAARLPTAACRRQRQWPRVATDHPVTTRAVAPSWVRRSGPGC